MAQIYNPSNTLNDQLDVKDLQGVTVTGNGSSSRVKEWVPVRTLKNSVASQAFNGDPDQNYGALAADIPDNFATNEQPKLKFLFTVEFKPRNGLTNFENYWGDESMDDNRFALKKAGRPSFQFIYEDVNFYGKRQKVGTKTDYGTVTLTFYDDVVNRSHSIVSQYLRTVSPIANITREQANNLEGSEGGAITYGALPNGNENGPFQWMRVTHHMLNENAAPATSSSDSTLGQAKQVYYDYLNPKILNVTLDELDMTQSDVNNVEIVFVFDSVNISYSDVTTSNPTTISSSNTNPSSGADSSTPITSDPTSNTTAESIQQNTNAINQKRQGFIPPFDSSINGF